MMTTRIAKNGSGGIAARRSAVRMRLPALGVGIALVLAACSGGSQTPIDAVIPSNQAAGTSVATGTSQATGTSVDTSPNSGTGARALTDDEAVRVAQFRFNNYNAGTRAISGTLTDGTVQVAITGWINYLDHVGYALATPGNSEAASPFLVEWTLGEVGIQNYAADSAPLPVPTSGWQVQEFDATASFLANAQAILLNLASDRPDNPQLLTQSSAQWLRSDTINSVAVDVFAGPKEADGQAPDPNDTSQARIRYWIDATGHLLRVELRLTGDQWSVIDFADAPDVTIPNPNASGGETTGAGQSPAVSAGG